MKQSTTKEEIEKTVEKKEKSGGLKWVGVVDRQQNRKNKKNKGKHRQI